MKTVTENILAALVDRPREFEAHLATLVPRLLDVDPISTTELANLLYAAAPGPMSAAVRMMIFKALAKMATGELASYARRGPAISDKRRSLGGHWYTQERKPWLWAAYGVPNTELVKRCPTCGHKLKK